MKFLIEDLEKDLDQLLYKIYTGRDSIDHKIATMINTRRKYRNKPEIQKMINNYLTKLYDDKYGDKETISESSNQLKDMALFNKRKKKQTSLSTFFADPVRGMENLNKNLKNEVSDNCEQCAECPSESAPAASGEAAGGGLGESLNEVNHKFKVGDKIKIINMKDEPDYAGREGVIKHIDDMGQLHGSWGGLAVVPEEDEIEFKSEGQANDALGESYEMEDEKDIKERKKMESINIRESLNNIDKETMNTDLLNMYESCSLNNEEKAEIANLIIEEDIEGINSYLSKKLNEDDEGDYFNDDYDEDDSDFFDDEYEEPEFNELDSDWTEYYIYLEDLRRSGVTNMFGASPYLANEFNISERDARKVLADWMKNYNELSNKFGWRKGE